MYFFIKIRNISIFLTDQMRRYLFTSVTKNSINKQSEMMRKLMRKNEMNRHQNEGFGISGMIKTEPCLKKQRRINILNKIFMNYITDFMSTGELNSRLINKNLEIMYVKITSNFQLVNVYYTDNSIDESDTEEILKNCAFDLRNQLCQLHVIGKVPPIQFVKCKHLEVEKEIERRLAIADYGEDYVPSLYPFSANHVISTKICIDSNNENLNNPDDNFTITLPVMKHNVFDLDHAKIMLKIKASLNQSKQGLRKRAKNEQFNLISASESTPQKTPRLLTQKETEDRFDKFLKDKQRERRLKYKNANKKDNISSLYEENLDDDDDFYDNDYDKDDHFDNNNYDIDSDVKS